MSGDGSTLAVGAVGEDSNATGINGVQTDDSASGSGAVYVFTKTRNAWAQQAYLKSSNSEAADLFGYGVGLSDDGNALAVAGYDEDGSGKGVNPPNDNGGNGTGAIYAFDRRGGSLAAERLLQGIAVAAQRCARLRRRDQRRWQHHCGRHGGRELPERRHQPVGLRRRYVSSTTGGGVSGRRVCVGAPR